jgi:hypothetical protein
VLAAADADGRLAVTGITVPDDVILCDFCNTETSDPVPVLYGSHAPACRAGVEADLAGPRDGRLPPRRCFPLGTWQDFEDKLQAQSLERREVIHGLPVALVARLPVLLIGPPDAAKSERA